MSAPVTAAPDALSVLRGHRVVPVVVLDDPDRADAMGAAGRAAVVQRFTTRAQCATLAAIVRAALG